jgi:hypothetical protein
MSAHQHEWILDEVDESVSYFDKHGDRHVVVYELGSDAEANRLITAAPKLRAHLEFAVKVLSGIPAIGGTAQVEAMRATLAKLEGRT